MTYDLRTIPPLLKERGERGIAHGGVILVHERSIVPGDFGGLIRALERLLAALGDADWRDRVVFLTR